MEKIYSVETPSLDPLYFRLSDIPHKSAIDFIKSNKNHRSIRLYCNGEWVAKHNYKRNKYLQETGNRIVLFVTEVPESYNGFVGRFEKEKNNCR